MKVSIWYRNKPTLMILGAGPVGLVASHLLSEHFKIKIFDTAIPIEKPKHFSSQVVSLVAPSLKLLSKQIDTKSLLMQPYYKVKCSVNEREFGFAMEACIVDVPSLKHELFQNLPKSVEFIQGSVDGIKNEETNIQIHCNSEWHSGSLALNTMGKYNAFLNNIERFDYLEMGIVAKLKLNSVNKCAFQRFLPSGPIAMLPTGLDTASLVWTLPREFAEEVLKYSKDPQLRKDLVSIAFQNEEVDLDYKFYNMDKQVAIDSDIFPTIESVAEFRSFPLGFHHLSNYGRDRLITVGDAAHSLHPLAGMGLNIGLADVFTLNDVLKNNLTLVNSDKILQLYEKKAHSRNSSVIWACDIIHDLFSTRNSILSAARNLSLRLFQTESFWSNLLSTKVNKLY
eukprot:NODE_6_length_70510_cov_1.054395.p22 type:complete len:396 gc:universal NODE_6_length_70510_cov_1.054395:12710-11523(-)